MWCLQARWSVESVHTKNIVSILHLLVALARHFRWYSWSSWFWRGGVVVLLMVPEYSTKMVHNPLQGSYSTAGKRCRWRCDRDKKRRGETSMSLSPLITIMFVFRCSLIVWSLRSWLPTTTKWGCVVRGTPSTPSSTTPLTSFRYLGSSIFHFNWLWTMGNSDGINTNTLLAPDCQ